MFISEAFAQAAAPAAPGGLENLQQFLPLILIFVVFYFLLLRPQQKKMKAHRELVSNLRRGDRVLTQGGILGNIVKVLNDTEVQVEIAEGVRVRVMRSAIAEVLAKTEPVGGAKDSAAKEGKESKETAEASTEGEPIQPSAEGSTQAQTKSSSPLAKLFGKK